MVAPSMLAAMPAQSQGWRIQWTNTNGNTVRIATGRLLKTSVMAVSGGAVRFCRLHQERR
jgi:hypothetical protein